MLIKFLSVLQLLPTGTLKDLQLKTVVQLPTITI